MSSSSAIGGYFELELKSSDNPLVGGIRLNSGRSAFEYILRSIKPAKVHIPKFTCDAILHPLNSLGIPYEFYSIDANLEMVDMIDVADNELILYTNYFGIKNDYAKKLGTMYGPRLVYDCAQAFYAEPLTGSPTFYSPRKFFGLPDGGLLYGIDELNEQLPTDVSTNRVGHLMKRIELGPEAGYDDYKKNEASIAQADMSHMSRLTQRLLESVDIEGARCIRNNNFAILHEALADSNKFTSIITSPNGPLCYPYFTSADLRQRLIDHNIFVATYWPNIFDWADSADVEHQLALGILPLPIDQRYDEMDMRRILEVING